MQTDPFPPEKQKYIGGLLSPHHTIEFIDRSGNTLYNSSLPQSIDVVL
jgi:hypothetical protein